MSTICGIEIDLLKKAPEPEELAEIVAHFDSTRQAEFFISLGESLRNCCGGRVFMQWQYIADAIKEREEFYCDGSGSDLVKELYVRLALSPATVD